MSEKLMLFSQITIKSRGCFDLVGAVIVSAERHALKIFALYVSQGLRLVVRLDALPPTASIAWRFRYANSDHSERRAKVVDDYLRQYGRPLPRATRVSNVLMS
jgi:hypothetical protein